MSVAEFTVYHTISGQTIAGQETGREDGIITVRGASFAEIHPSLTRFNFTPIRLVDPATLYAMYQTALLGEQPMPEIMRPQFEAYLEQMGVKSVDVV